MLISTLVEMFTDQNAKQKVFVGNEDKIVLLSPWHWWALCIVCVGGGEVTLPLRLQSACGKPFCFRAILSPNFPAILQAGSWTLRSTCRRRTSSATNCCRRTSVRTYS